MKNGKSFRFFYRINNITNAYFKQYKATFLVCTLFVLLGILTGVLTVLKYSKSITIENIFDNNLLLVLKGDRSSFGLFFSYLLIHSIIFCIIILLNQKPWLITLTALCLVYLGYVFGYNFIILITLFGFVGFLNVIIIIVPVELFLIFITITIAAIAIKRNLIIKKYGCNYFNSICFFNLNKMYLTLFLLFSFVLLIKCTLLPIIRVTIIIN